MVLINTLYLVVLTRNIEDADSDSTLNLTININGSDHVDYNPGNPTGVGEAHMYGRLFVSIYLPYKRYTRSSDRTI